VQARRGWRILRPAKKNSWASGVYAMFRWLQSQWVHCRIELYSVTRVEWLYRFFWYTVLGLFAREYWRWCSDIPPSGKAVLALALVASLMPLRSEFRRGAAWHGIEKSVWVLLLFAFFYLENIAIDRERMISKQAEAKTLRAIATGFQGVITDEQKNFSTVIETSQANFRALIEGEQRQFDQTQRNSVTAQKKEHAQFTSVLGKQQAMLTAQQEFAEGLAGRLVPGNAPTPDNGCTEQGVFAKSNEVLLITSGENASIVSKFPHTVLKVSGMNMVSIDRVAGTGAIALGVESRDADGKIAFRMDKNGTVVRDNSLIPLHPDKSTFLLQDAYGRDLLKAQFVNHNTISVDGSVPYCGQIISLQPRGMTQSCISAPVPTDIELMVRCPKPPS
jgi:hypothetical protein